MTSTRMYSRMRTLQATGDMTCEWASSQHFNITANLFLTSRVEEHPKRSGGSKPLVPTRVRDEGVRALRVRGCKSP